MVRKEASKRGLVIVDTARSQDEENACDLDYDLVRYTGPIVFEKGEELSVVTIEIKHDTKEERTEFFNMRIGSIHKRVKRAANRMITKARVEVIVMKRSFKVFDHVQPSDRVTVRSEKLHVKETAVTLLDYVSYKKDKSTLTSKDMWMSFQKEEEEEEEEGTEEPERVSMRFYRKGLDKDTAIKALKKGNMKLEPAPGHDYSENPLWITTSIKHSRQFKTDDHKHSFCVAFTIDMEKFAKVFDAKKILDFSDNDARKLAKKIHRGIKSEEFCLFETQYLTEHSYHKVNLGLWEKHVEKFNNCIIKSEMMNQTRVRGGNGAEEIKILPVILTENGLSTPNPRASVHSETSTRLKK